MEFSQLEYEFKVLFNKCIFYIYIKSFYGKLGKAFLVVVGGISGLFLSIFLLFQL